MASKLTDRAAPAVVVPHGATTPHRATSRLSPFLRVPILVVLSAFIRSILLSTSTNFLGQELGHISRRSDDLVTPLGLLGYRALLLVLGWQASYDAWDVAYLTVITNTPIAYLLLTYYQISPYTIAAHVATEVISIAFPTYLLRPRSAIHNPNVPLRNRFLLNSFQVQVSAALLAIGVYVTVLWGALKTNVLNEFLITHFDLPTMEGAHIETPLSIVAKILATGVATEKFLLNPSIGAQPPSGAATPVTTFDPATATLPETVKHNFWFGSRRTRTLIKQTAVLSAFVLANTVERVLTIEGTDVTGAAGYAGLWIFSILISAAWWGWVGNTEL